MRYIKSKHIKLIFFILFFYSIFIILKKLINIYTISILFIIIFTLYIYNKKLFKKIVYKIIYKDKKSRLFFKDKIHAAKISLEGLSEINNKINDKVTAELQNYEKNKLESQLRLGDYKVTLFGAGSSGKTSLARSLLNNFVGSTSPTLGTTKKIMNYKIKIPLLKRNIKIIDTPGLFEPSEKGEEREKSTIKQATSSDLILFVLDQDINKYELYLIDELSKIGKRIIIVLNKCDLRSKEENDLIKNNIKKIILSINNEISIVKTIAIRSNSNKELNALNISTDVSNLFNEIIYILDNDGEELLADNILFNSIKLGIKSKNFIEDQRNIKASKIIKKYMLITSGVILVNPLPGVDLLATTSVNVQMIIDISKIYEVKITRKQAKDLSKTLLVTITKLGILKGGLSIISSTLSSSFTTIIISKTIQSITSGWLIKIVGLSLIKYYKNGQNWGDGGIQQVVEEIYQINKREDVLNNFIKEAISSIEINKNNCYPKKLPPYIR